MVVTKEIIKSIIQLAKVLVDNHSDEVENNNDTASRIKVIASALDNGENIEVTDKLDSICNQACGNMSIEVYSAIVNAALDEYFSKDDNTFRQIVDLRDDINIPKVVTLVGYYIRYVCSDDVLKIVRH